MVLGAGEGGNGDVARLPSTDCQAGTWGAFVLSLPLSGHHGDFTEKETSSGRSPGWEVMGRQAETLLPAHLQVSV